jgi:hypothetical protein
MKVFYVSWMACVVAGQATAATVRRSQELPRAVVNSEPRGLKGKEKKRMMMDGGMNKKGMMRCNAPQEPPMKMSAMMMSGQKATFAPGNFNWGYYVRE